MTKKGNWNLRYLYSYQIKISFLKLLLYNRPAAEVKFPLFILLITRCFKDSSKIDKDSQVVKFCRFLKASVMYLNAAENYFNLQPIEYNVSSITITKRERPKSALYLRLKTRKLFKIVKKGTFGLFENLVCCKIFLKMKERPFGDIKKLSEKN